MNTGLKWFVCLAVCVTIIGCEAENTPPEANPDPSTQKPLPQTPPVLSVGGKVSLPRVDGFCYETDFFDPTIEMRPLFDNEAAALIIRCRKTEGMGGIGAWETHALVWAERSLSAEVSYRTVNVQVHQFYPFDSGDRATQARYWPVDIDGDSLQDLVVFYWACGEQGRYDDDRQYRRYPFDRPVAIRLIQRKMLDGRPFGITSDEALGWDDVKKSPEKFAKLLAAALARAEDAVWRERLKKAIATLHD